MAWSGRRSWDPGRMRFAGRAFGVRRSEEGRRAVVRASRRAIDGSRYRLDVLLASLVVEVLDAPFCTIDVS